MKLLVLAQTPPPVHGQSVMVRAMVQGLPARGVPVHHINLSLSRDVADIGRWRWGKMRATMVFALQTVAARFRHGCDTLYYVPAPPRKRGALYRDWLVMALCRPFYRRLVLHWHAAGLAELLQSAPVGVEALITRLLLGRADLAIVLASSLRADADSLDAKRIAVVHNGVPDPGSLPPPPREGAFHLLFLATCSVEKGLFAAAEAVVAANHRVRASPEAPAFTLTVAGPFDSRETAARFSALAADNATALIYAGVVDDDGKRNLFARSHALLFPTRYGAEGQPLVVLEAFAHDRPVVATRWRALPEIVDDEVGRLITPGDTMEAVAALLDLREHPPAPGVCRERFLAHFTVDRHLDALATSLVSS